MQSKKKLAEAPKPKASHKPSKASPQTFKASSQVSKASAQIHKAPTYPSNLKSRVHLLWLHSLPLLYRPVPLVVLREVATYLSDPPLLVLLSYSSFSTFDLSTGRPILRKKTQLDERKSIGNPSYAVLNRIKLLCCGGSGTF